MRTIRFKARAKKTKEWVEGYYATIHAPRYGDENELIGFDECPAIINDDYDPDRDHWTDIYHQTLCQQTDMEDADGIKIWENDILRLSPFGKPESQYTGDVVWMQTCFAVEDDRGHHEPLSTLRNLCKIEVIGNRYDEG
jgi:hypothetical protein